MIGRPKSPTPLSLEDLPSGPPTGTHLVNISDIDDHGGKDILFEEDGHRINVFVQKWRGEFHVYENRCPHAGTPLNLFNDRFLNLEETGLLCRTHGALFDPESGMCTHGPCKRQFLRKVAFVEKEGALYTA